MRSGLVRSAALILFNAGTTVAADVYLPVTFHAEEQIIKTSACLQVVEWIYPQTSGWKGFGKAPNEAEKALEAVIDAMKRKNRDQLFQVSDLSGAGGSQDFDRQASAFFSQFDTLELVAVPRAYSMDGLAIFFGDFRAGSRRVFAPLVLAAKEDATFQFLPRRTQQLAYVLVKDWFDAPWGPSRTDSPAYCSTSEITRATHRVPLSIANAQAAISPQSFLYLRGGPVEATDMGARVKSAMRRIQSAIAKDNIDGLMPLMTATGAKRLREWFSSAGENERTGYIKALADFKAYFLFDSAPLVVVYGKAESGSVRVMYFTVGGGETLLWTNSSHVTSADEVFKRGRLLREASLRQPFSGIALK